MKAMLRPFSALATTWNAYRLFRQDKLLNEMDSDTVAKWAACIPIWKAKLDTFNVIMHRPWMRNIYRHDDVERAGFVHHGVGTASR